MASVSAWLLAAWACGASPAPAPPSSSAPGGGVTITGSERLGWDEPASSSSIASGYTYWIYVDNARRRLDAATCSAPSGPAGFPCAAPLPPLTPGQHVLELSASVGADGTNEGPRSQPITVVVASAASAAAPAPGDPGAEKGPLTTRTADGITLTAEVVAKADRPVALRFAPDGRLFVAEQDGRILVVEDGSVQPEPALVLNDVVIGPTAGLLDVALAPDFDRSHLVYVVYTVMGPDGLEKNVARYREVQNKLGEGAVLLSGIPASLDRDSAALAFGPDGKLYVLTGEPADARGPVADLAEGQVLRLNRDGTTPGDNPGYSPIVRRSLLAPAALVWPHASGPPLLVQSDGHPDATGGTGGPIAAWREGDRLTVVPAPTSAAICPSAPVRELRSDLFVAAPSGGAALRVRLEAANTGPVPVEALFQGKLGRVGAVACSPAGNLFVATRHLQTQRSVPDQILRITAQRNH